MATDASASLRRFVEAQDASGAFRHALAELREGRKTSHWMWFVFPQLAGLGTSAMARRYGIGSLEEATAYLSDPVLGGRLRLAAALVLELDAQPVVVFGPLDAMKLRSSMTLFHRAAPDEALFAAILDRCFGGVPDERTDALLGAPAE